MIPDKAPYWKSESNQHSSEGDLRSSFAAGEIINYREMCEAEKSQLQRGMNFRLSQTHSCCITMRRRWCPI